LIKNIIEDYIIETYSLRPKKIVYIWETYDLDTYENENEHLKDRALCLKEFLNLDHLELWELMPLGNHYDMPSFGLYLGDTHYEYAVGTDSEADNAAYDYLDSYIDEFGYFSVSEYYWQNKINGKAVKDYFSGNNYDLISDSPEDYNVEKTMTTEASEELETLNNKYDELIETRSKTKTGSKEFEKIDSELSDIHDRIEELEDEDSEYWEYTEENIQKRSDEMDEEIEDDPVEYLKNLGYIDKDGSRELERIADYFFR
jgi:hypothetical protein